METLRDKLEKIAGEYASKVGKLLNYKPEFWVGPSVSIDCCCYGDVYFLSLAEMQVIIDHMDEWQKKYGSDEKVGETVIGWLDFVNDDNWDEEHGLWRDGPRINLWSWLKGLRPEQLKWTEYDELLKLETQVKVLKQVSETYPTASIYNATTQIESRVNAIRKRMEEETKEALKKSPSYQEFLKLMEDEVNP